MTAENTEKSEIYRFGDWQLDADRRELRNAGEGVTMQPKAFELLLYLLRNRHRAVDKDELQDRLWPRSIVTETALTRCVMKARRAVGDDADRQLIIKTVHGHGYRFIAEIDDASPASSATDTAAARKPSKFRFAAIAASVVVAVVAAWWLFAPPAYSGAMRLAVLPVENATGEAELDWSRTGFMVMMNRMFEDRSVAVVSGRSVSSLAGEQSLEELTAADSEFRTILQKTTGSTHLLATSLQRDGELYRLTYTISGGDDRPEQRTIVGQEPARLITQLVDTVTKLVTTGAPELPRMSIVSDDDFINEAYARAMGLEFEGRYEEAQRLFQVIIEQNGQLFWPRYEFALCARNLRDFETAERLFIELRNETEAKGELKRLAAVNNSLGIMYMGQRRNDEARTAFESTIRSGQRSKRAEICRSSTTEHGAAVQESRRSAQSVRTHARVRRNYASFGIESLPGTLLNNPVWRAHPDG